MTQEHPEQPESVPVVVLTELVESWREIADQYNEDGPNPFGVATDDCANELEAVIEAETRE